ncbi:unnamed protein product [Acanthoscelides obtectus]|nr:unnamed protein product [Acanthoscelides obtectus]CAK1658543.1 Adenosine deaminase-like protein [Acanthoscelides obtectus]
MTEVLNKSQRSLSECFEVFKIAHNATNNVEAVFAATQSVISDFHMDHVVYLELRTTPRAGQDMSKEDYIAAVVTAILANPLEIIVKLILSIDRRNSIEQSLDSLNVILKMKLKYPDVIVGIDFSGNPAEGEFNEDLFKKAREGGLKTSIHCGEIRNDEEIEKILKFGPDRLGHATFLHPEYEGNPNNWKLYLEKKIPVECCLTSNVICGTTKSYPEHHIREWIRNSLPHCICTDDKGVFGTSLTKEYTLVAEHHGLKPKDLWQTTCNSVDYIFASDDIKTRLKVKLMNWYNKHERQLCRF